MPGNGPAGELSIGAHYASIKALFDDAVVVSKKKTHAPRGTGARHAQDAGADIAAIENHAGWGKGRLSTNYLSRICDAKFRARWLVAHSQENDYGLPGTPFYRPLNCSGCCFHVLRSMPWDAMVMRIGYNGQRT
jgi:hypothetical protein